DGFLDQINFDDEAYYLGYLSGLALDLMMRPERWQKKVKRGISPLKILAQTVRPERQRANPIRQRQFIDLSVKEMEKIDRNGQLDNVIRHLAKPKGILLGVDTSSAEQGSFNVSGFYRSFFNYQDLSDVQFIKLASDVIFRTTSFRLGFKRGEIWTRARKTPCGFKKNTTLIPLRERSFKTDKDILTSTQFQGPIRKIKGKTRTWFCLKESP
ncbi:MAG: hypothetical protein AAF203_05750, partial [Pseudomonadota bacterium]